MCFGDWRSRRPVLSNNTAQLAVSFHIDSNHPEEDHPEAQGYYRAAAYGSFLAPSFADRVSQVLFG
jgi:hypothetical protein